MRKVNEAKAWTGLSQAYAAHFGDPDSIWRVDNKHGTGMLDVHMARPRPAWIELKSGEMGIETITLYHPLTMPQFRFMNAVSQSAIAGVLILTPDGWWYCPAEHFPIMSVDQKLLTHTRRWFFYTSVGELITRFFDDILTAR